MLNIVRTIIFNILAFIAILVYGVLLIPSFFSYKCAHKCSCVFMTTLLMLAKYITGVSFIIENKDIIKKNGIIIACNHCSAWETFFIAYYFNIPIFILKKSLLNIPILGNFLRILRMIGIDRKSYSKRFQHIIIEKTSKALNTGRNIAIFPQGTRVPIKETFNYKKYPYKPGIAIFARGHTVCTISTDSRKYFGKSLFSLKKTGTITVHFNDVINVPHNATKNDILNQVQDSIESGCRKILNA